MSVAATIQAVCLLLFAVSLVGAAAQDLRLMQIGNRFPLAIMALFAIAAGAGVASDRVSATALAFAVLCAAAVFVAGAAAFAAGALGGGDVKLLAAASLFAGASHIGDFLAITALAGGVLGLAALAGLPMGQPAGAHGTGLSARLRLGVPYGPAIAAGGLWVAGSRLVSF